MILNEVNLEKPCRKIKVQHIASINTDVITKFSTKCFDNTGFDVN